MLRERVSGGAKAAGRRSVEIVKPHLGPVLVAVSISAIYFILDLRGGDLAAHLYRATLFKREGLFVWNYNWYGGHYLVSYGVIFPFLAAAVGVRLAGAIAFVAGTLLFSILAQKVFSKRGADAAAYVFAVAFSATLVIGQLPYALSMTIGLAAVLAAADKRTWVAAFLAINCALTSPLAALFISFITFVIWTSSRQRPYMAVALGTLLPALLLSELFPEGGSQPFAFASYLGALIFTAFFWFFVRDDLDREVRRLVGSGVLLYLIFLTGNEIVPSPVGGNAIRLGMLLFPTVAAAALWPRSGRYALAIIIPLMYWQAGPAVWAIAHQDQTANPKYFAPVNAFLDKRDPKRDQKVEIVFTRNHFEAAYVASYRPIARGWERQLDTKENAVFYGNDLNATTYAQWLIANNVRWVALPNAVPDYSARVEEQLIDNGLSYLHLEATLTDWKIYKVDLPMTSDPGPHFLNNNDPALGFSVQPQHYGATITTIRWQRFLRPSIGCIESSSDGFLELLMPTAKVMGATPSGGKVSSRPPVVTLTSDFSIGRLVGASPSCAVGWVHNSDNTITRTPVKIKPGGTT